jgi:hypothetical protein
MAPPTLLLPRLVAMEGLIEAPGQTFLHEDVLFLEPSILW